MGGTITAAEGAKVGWCRQRRICERREHCHKQNEQESRSDRTRQRSRDGMGRHDASFAGTGGVQWLSQSLYGCL
jgi:hypothetical protein